MIRDYKQEDADDIVSIWRAATDLAHPFLAEDFVEQEARNLRNIYLVHAKTQVLEIGGKTIGFIAMIGNEIGGLFLHPDMHGNGHGRALVDRVASNVGDLEVDVFERNTIGRRFYDRYGFCQIDKSTHDATGETILRLACPQKAEGAFS